MRVSFLHRCVNLRRRNDLLPLLARLHVRFLMLQWRLPLMAKIILPFSTIPFLSTCNVHFRSVSMVDLQSLRIGAHSGGMIKVENGIDFWLRAVCPRYISSSWRDCESYTARLSVTTISGHRRLARPKMKPVLYNRPFGIKFVLVLGKSLSISPNQGYQYQFPKLYLIGVQTVYPDKE